MSIIGNSLTLLYLKVRGFFKRRYPPLDIARTKTPETGLLESQCLAIGGANCHYSVRCCHHSGYLCMFVARASLKVFACGGRGVECFHPTDRFERSSFNQAVPPPEVSPTFEVNVAISILPTIPSLRSTLKVLFLSVDWLLDYSRCTTGYFSRPSELKSAPVKP